MQKTSRFEPGTLCLAFVGGRPSGRMHSRAGALPQRHREHQPFLTSLTSASTTLSSAGLACSPPAAPAAPAGGMVGKLRGSLGSDGGFGDWQRFLHAFSFQSAFTGHAFGGTRACDGCWPVPFLLRSGFRAFGGGIAFREFCRSAVSYRRGNDFFLLVYRRTV